MRPRGRPPRTRGVYSFEDPLLLVPDAVVLDTSFVVHALIRTQPSHQPALEFLQRLAEAETLILYNRLLEVELAETAIYSGVNRIVTTDTHFGAVPERLLTVYTTSSRLAACRRQR